MRRPPVRDRPLTAENLLHDFGGRAAVTREGVRTLFDALDADQSGALARWTAMFGRWAGRAIEKLPQHLARLAAHYDVAADGDCPDFRASENGTVPFAASNAARLLFAMQTYYALLVNRLAERFGRGRVDGSLPGNPFSWCDAARSPSVESFRERLAEACGRYRVDGDCPNSRASENGTVPLAAPGDGQCDLFKPLYMSLFPRPLRRQLGEYYTPDWLADHVLDQVGYRGQPGDRLLDPACGSGTFLMLALRRWLKNAECEMMNDELPSPTHHSSFIIHHFPIVGFDLNPLAVMTARANLLIALADVLPPGGPVELPVYLHDSILGQGETGAAGGEAFDFVVGNPPWIAWDNLPDDVRQATKPLWERYGLFSLSGNEARHGGGKKDLSMLMLYAAADRYLKPHGRLGMVITQTLFQTKGAGDGFRRFRLGDDGPPLRVIRVDDMVALRPFGDAANWTSTIVLEKGAATEYPVAYFQWRVESGEWRAKKGREESEGREERGEGRGNDECRMVNDECSGPIHHSSFSIQHCLARPIDPAKPTSPWLISADDSALHLPRSAFRLHPSSLILHPSSADCVAHLGANSGGANGVYWLEVLGPCDGGVLVRNLAGRGKHRVETVEQVIEPDLLYPLLRWGDVARYSTAASAYLLLAQDPATRAGIDEPVMRAKYPRTLAYLERFRELLAARAAYRRYQQGGPFYAMYNVGPYTVAPIKVVWRRMDRRINAAVVEPLEAGETPAPQFRPAIPQETCVLVACESSDEAHYLCAMLNSAAVGELVAAHSVRGGKSFGTPGMFDFLPLRRFRPDDPRHVELAELSRRAHAANHHGESHVAIEPVGVVQQRIDALASADG